MPSKSCSQTYLLVARNSSSVAEIALASGTKPLLVCLLPRSVFFLRSVRAYEN